MTRTTVGRTILTTLTTALALALLSAILVPAPTSAQTGHDLMQQALVKEQAEGDLKGAIELYERIVAEFADDRGLGARALFRKGECYEKLGSREAREAYRALLERYPDQTELASRAEERLARLERQATGADEAAGEPTLRTRLVWDGDAQGPLPDGRRVLYIDWNTGDLAIRDLVSGESRKLTDEGSWDEGLQEYAVGAVVSPDGAEVAYWWVTYRYGSDEEHRNELRVADTESGHHRTLHRGRGGDEMIPFAWSSDRRKILVGRSDGIESGASLLLGTISADGGDFHPLKRFSHGSGVSAAFSPDGKQVVVSYPVPEDSARSDILLLSVEDGAEVPLVTHPADDYLLGWIPGTRQILFRSDRSGSWDALTLEVDPEGASHPPRPVQRRIGQIEGLGFAADGTLFYSTFTRWFDLALAPFNDTAGAVDLDRGESLLGSNFEPVWSPDGRRLAYVSVARRPSGDSFNELHVRDLEGGSDRTLVRGLVRYVRHMSWSPDGESLLFTGRHSGDEGESFYAVDAETGRAEEILEIPAEGRWWLGRAVWAPEGDAIIYTLFERLIRRDLRTGEERVLFRHPRLIGRQLAPSPDGRWLALGIGSPTWTGNPHAELRQGGRIVILPSDGGELREITRVTAPGRVSTTLTWGPDGETIYFPQRDFDRKVTRLWRAPVTGRGAEPVWDGGGWVMGFALHPGGKRAAVATYTQETQIWTLEGLVAAVQGLD